ncbi:Ig-like domain-containing protein [Oscillospiraceae bacterium LTW-04]|nr:Ig-like domain-containing protein [Oscillospiraceae bacterium MB24-C1]
MIRSKKTTLIGFIIAVLIVGIAIAVYATKLPTFDIVPLSASLSSMKTEYSGHNVKVDNLVSASKELARLNAMLMLEDAIGNADEVKTVLREADAIINRLDVNDPIVTIENKEQSTKALAELQKSLDMAMTHYGIEKAEVLMERVDIGIAEHTGDIGETLTVTPHLYPTFVEYSVLDWESTDNTIVTVTEDGDITLVGAGTATVKVTENKSGVSSSVVITVKAPVVKPPVTPPVQKPVEKPVTPPVAEKPVEKPVEQTQDNAGTGGNAQQSGTSSGGRGYTVDGDMEERIRGGSDPNDNYYTGEELERISQDEERELFKDVKWR